MENKVLIKLIVPEIDKSFDIFVPVNEVVWKVKKLLLKAINDLDNVDFDIDKEYLLMQKDNSHIYKNNDIILDTDIRNASEIILLSKE